MICSDFCPFRNKFDYCEMTMRAIGRVTICPHCVIHRSVRDVCSGKSERKASHAKK